MNLITKLAKLGLTGLVAVNLYLPNFYPKVLAETRRPVLPPRPMRVVIGSGTVTAKNGSVLTISKDGKNYTINTDSNTRFLRRYWGKTNIDEIQIGHIVNVVGKWTDESKTIINATLIRDTSIQVRNGVFFGTVRSLTSDGWTMTTRHRGNQMVVISNSSKLVNRRGETMPQSQILVGHRVRVKGEWDRSTNKIFNVTHVKDFSLPVRPVPSPSP